LKKWHDNLEILKYVAALRNSGYTWAFIYENIEKKYPKEEFSNPDTVRKRFHDKSFFLQNIEVDNSIAYYTYKEAYAELCKFVGKDEKKPLPVKKSKKKKKKILVISDTHIPFCNKTMLKEIVNKHKDSDMLVIAGDFLDCYSVSRFSKKSIIPLKEELTQATSILDWLASIFPEIIIADGNHTDRVRKYFEQRIDPSLMFLVQYDVLDLISRGHKNVEIVKDHYIFPDGNGEADIGYFKTIGEDFVVGHFEKSSKIPARAAQDAYGWLQSWSKIFDIKEIRLFLQGHTHRLSKIPLHTGTPVIGETGCISQVLDYAIDAGARYTGHLNGYWVVIQENGITDLNESNFYIS
jgi:predicted phosphodiesterase